MICPCCGEAVTHTERVDLPAHQPVDVQPATGNAPGGTVGMMDIERYIKFIPCGHGFEYPKYKQWRQALLKANSKFKRGQILDAEHYLDKVTELEEKMLATMERSI